LFGLSRKAVENEPLKIFLAVSDLERKREKPFEPATAERLVNSWRAFGSQYPLLNETGGLRDSTLVLFLDVAKSVAEMKDQQAKSDVAGTVQSLTGIWQVLVRQKLIPAKDADAALAAVLGPFPKLRQMRDLYDAGQAGVLALLKATGAPAGVNPQDRMLDLLAGAVQPADQDTQSLIVGEMLRAFEAQRLVSLKTLFDLSDQLEAVAKGEKPNTALLNRLSARVSDLNLPKSMLSTQEKNSYAFGYYVDRHVDAQRKLNLRGAIEKAAGQPEKLRELKGVLAPYLRDTLVGLLYIHYAPPGAQVLYTNPLFARSHDFIGVQGSPQTWRSTEVLGTGWPSNAGGRLVGSLANLPYALAEAEQNFLIPTREQALIWGDLVPQMLVSSTLPRFWNVAPVQLHMVGLQMRLGEALLAEGALSAKVREQAMDLLEHSAPPARLRRVELLLTAGDTAGALEEVTPAELYRIGGQALASRLDVAGPFAAEMRALAAAEPAKCSPAALSEAFGTPKPTLANSHHPELLELRTFPTLMGYSSRILAESWESNNLFFAALADELYLAPSRLNVLIPEWTQKTVEQIFATHLEDWPALLRSMRVIADNVRTQTRKLQALEQKASLEE
jgi:hypothetical protein